MNLGIYLDSSIEASYSLKKLLKDYIPKQSPLETLAITITIAPHAIIMITDDLIDFEDPVLSSGLYQRLEFIIYEHATFSYRMHYVPLPGVTYQTWDDPTIIHKDLVFKLAGPYAYAKVKCACFGLSNRIFKFTTLQDHQVAYTRSKVRIRSVLDGNAKFDCRSAIKIIKTAHHVTAEQFNNNILISKSAHALSIPQLEIESEEVKCKHGATVSKLDDDEMFYLQSRGIDPINTRDLLINAFLSVHF